MSSHHDRAQRAAPRIRIALASALVPIAIVTVVGVVLLWPKHAHPRATSNLGQSADLYNATVLRVASGPCSGGGASSGECFTVFLRITNGPDHGKRASLPDMTFGVGSPVLAGGDKIVVGRTLDPVSGHVDYYFADFQRRTPLLLLAAVFALIVVGVARWRGAAAIVGLGIAWVVLVRFVIPDILEGRSPVAVSLVAGALILFVVMYVAHGFNARTSTAILGTMASLALTGALAAAFIAAAHLTGLSSEEATYVQALTSHVSLTGLILAGVVIGSLGVLNDVTVTQASAVWEIHDANPSRGVRELYQSGMRVGRDHIASVVYTLVLAYAGASLPLLIVFTLSGQHAGNVLTSDVVAEEIVRTLVGSVGLVASVPITTALAAVVVKQNYVGREGFEPP